MQISLFLTLLLMGLTGGLHCAAMCGGLVVASERAMLPVAREQVLWPARSLLWRSLQLQLARVVTYSLLGMVAGAVGSGLWAVQARGVQVGLFVLGNLVLAASGVWLVRVAWGPRAAACAPVVRARASWTQRLRSHLSAGAARLVQRLLPLASVPRRIGAGLLWGLLPCGLVYSALSLALLSGSAAGGALAMAAFGLGTLPHMLLAGHVLRRVSQRATARASRLGAGLVLIGFASWGLWRLLHVGGLPTLHGYCVV
ncbi:MAG: sulfite exporter TauE/SafE family protein [Betaproteobacteria bacterium]|nr:sulfite exporter TauE/SafE family protein [Betaproteobacteria bacterium]